MLEFLNFNTFISQDVLIFWYYIGALFIPLLLWSARQYLIKHISYLKEINTAMHEYYRSLDLQQRLFLWATFIIIFICVEIFWRMMFEMMIGYFDMHDYLYQIMINTAK